MPADPLSNVNLFNPNAGIPAIQSLKPDTVIAFLHAPEEIVISRLKLWFPKLKENINSPHGAHFRLDGQIILRINKDPHFGTWIKGFGKHTSTIIAFLTNHFRLGEPDGRWQGDEEINPKLCRLYRIDYSLS